MTHASRTIFWVFAAAASATGLSTTWGQSIASWQTESDRGNATAQFLLGRAYHRGEGVEKDDIRSLELLTKAADGGSLEAMDGIGYLYLTGAGVEASESKALEWYRKAAEKGLPKAQLNFGLLLRQGKEIERSNEEGLKWLEKAARAGTLEANAALGRIFFSGDRLQRREPERAYEFLKVAAEGGDPVCQNIMGMVSRRGIGTPAKHKDSEQAIAWFRKAAEQGDAKAQTNLAVELGLKPGGERRAEAIEWLLLARMREEVNAIRIYEEFSHTITEAEATAAHEAASKRFRNLTDKEPPSLEAIAPPDLAVPPASQ